MKTLYQAIRPTRNMTTRLFLILASLNMVISGVPHSYRYAAPPSPSITELLSRNLQTIFPCRVSSMLSFNENYNETVRFYLYTRANVNTSHQMWSYQGFNPKVLNTSLNTIVLVHGYLDNMHTIFPLEAKYKFLTMMNVNVIIVDWAYFSMSCDYFWTVSHIPQVGRSVGEFVEYLIENGVSPKSVHIIGFSLGAHVSGMAGKTLTANNHAISRISGLDPALPLFSYNAPELRIDATDADFVDCIHTTAGLLGFDVSICQADFYPNGGMAAEPGCSWTDLVCSHERSYEYYIESLNRTHLFYADSCESLNKGVPYRCKSEGAQMGFFATPQHTGDFHLKTKPSSPYSFDISSVP